MIEVSRPLWESLESRPVLYEGQADDCVIEASHGTVRVWLSRCGTGYEGDSPYQVSCETRVAGVWVDPADETEERAWLREALASEDIDLPAFQREY